MKKYEWIEIHPGYQNLIRNRIKESEKEYTRQEQRAELLLRNPQFIKDLQEQHEVRELGGRSPEVDRWLSSSEEGLTIKDALDKSGEFLTETGLFRLCDRWGISRRWDMDKGSLSRFIEAAPSLLYNPSWAGLPTNLAVDAKIFPDDSRPDYLYIKIDPWTLPKDITSSWGRIEKLKKAIFGFSDHGKWNFGEALCWYDLRMKYRYSFGKIALLWQMEKAPHENEDDLKTRVRIGIKRIAGYIKRLTPAVELISIPQPEK